jgi:hypothetical protein
VSAIEFLCDLCVCALQQKAVQYWPTFDAAKPETNMAVYGAMDVTIRLEHRFPDFPSVLLRMFNVSPSQVIMMITPVFMVKLSREVFFALCFVVVVVVVVVVVYDNDVLFLFIVHRALICGFLLAPLLPPPRVLYVPGWCAIRSGSVAVADMARSRRAHQPTQGNGQTRQLVLSVSAGHSSACCGGWRTRLVDSLVPVACSPRQPKA